MTKEYIKTSEVVRLENTLENSRDRLLVHLLSHLGFQVVAEDHQSDFCLYAIALRPMST